MPTSPAAKVTDEAHVLCFASLTFACTPQENEASSSSFLEGVIPRYVQAGNVRGKVQLLHYKERIQMWPVLQLV